MYSKLVQDKLNQNAIEQYQNEERSILVKRLLDSETRFEDLLKATAIYMDALFELTK